jgi:hypothetical protein
LQASRTDKSTPGRGKFGVLKWGKYNGVWSIFLFEPRFLFFFTEGRTEESRLSAKK